MSLPVVQTLSRVARMHTCESTRILSIPRLSPFLPTTSSLSFPLFPRFHCRWESLLGFPRVNPNPSFGGKHADPCHYIILPTFQKDARSQEKLACPVSALRAHFRNCNLIGPPELMDAGPFAGAAREIARSGDRLRVFSSGSWALEAPRVFWQQTGRAWAVHREGVRVRPSLLQACWFPRMRSVPSLAVVFTFFWYAAYICCS
ncbi:hypothetical protein B0J14DRAFT_575451 [Halenospora varia]|nr:hypothetical protein B0J14DRAFT_575451 [Halenospora varia]